MLTTLLTESIKKLGLMPGIYVIMWIEGGGGMDKAICLLMILDILEEGQSGEENKEWWLSKMCLKDINISGRIGGEEEPKVHVVYDIHIVQRY